MGLVFFFPCEHTSYPKQKVLMEVQSAGYINHCMHGAKPVVRTAHTFPWRKLKCHMVPALGKHSYAHPELHYCLRSGLLGSPKAVVEATGPRQYLCFPHHQATG